MSTPDPTTGSGRTPAPAAPAPAVPAAAAQPNPASAAPTSSSASTSSTPTLPDIPTWLKTIGGLVSGGAAAKARRQDLGALLDEINGGTPTARGTAPTTGTP